MASRKFTMTEHCRRRVHCRACRMDKAFRDSIRRTFDWDGRCPLGYKVGVEPEVTKNRDRPKSATSPEPVRVVEGPEQPEEQSFEERYVSREAYAERQRICGECEHLHGSRCVVFKRGCGCGGDLHGSRRRDVACPEGKW